MPFYETHLFWFFSLLGLGRHVCLDAESLSLGFAATMIWLFFRSFRSFMVEAV